MFRKALSILTLVSLLASTAIAYEVNIDKGGVKQTEIILADVNFNTSSTTQKGLVWEKLFEESLFIAGSLGGSIHSGSQKQKGKVTRSRYRRPRLTRNNTKRKKTRSLGSKTLFRVTLDINYSPSASLV